MSLPRIPATWVWGLVSELRAGMRRVSDMRIAACGWLPHTSTMLLLLLLLIRHRYQLDKRRDCGSMHHVCVCVRTSFTGPDDSPELGLAAFTNG